MNSKDRQEEAIFEAARQIGDPRQRQVYLQAACAGDPAMRERLEEMLAAQPDADGFFQGGVVTLELPASTMALPTEKPGDRIGRYKLREKIGEGGCGVVYVADQEEPVRRRVAVKVIKLGMDTRNVVARFEAERQALAMMDHPNIAKVLDAGATETGRPFFVMELVRGIKMTEYCDQNQLSTRERLELFMKVCQAVQHAHQKGIIHRDLKPSNILVTLHDGVPVPKVIDFGIAKATEGRLTDLTVYTELHQFIGTPAYVSPEQAEMSGLDIDTRSDIYSLGVLLYELLTGKTPFDSKEMIAAGLDEMRRTIREREPMRPSTRLSTMLEGELTTTAHQRRIEAPRLIYLLRGDLDWIVMKALEKDRTRRYETANGLAADLQRFLANEPVVARPPTTIYRLHKAFRRNKLGFGAAGAVAVALLLGAVVSTWQAVRATRAQHTADHNATLAQAESIQALEAKREASENLLEARQNLYAAEMNLAEQALESGNTRRAQALLEGYPRPDEEDVRGFEWWYLWRLHYGNSRLTFPTGANWIRAWVAFSPDGKTLAIAGTPDVQLWDMTSGGSVRLLKGHHQPVRCVAYSPEGGMLASVDTEGIFILWDLGTETNLASFKVEIESVGEMLAGGGDPSLLFFPDEKVLAIARGGTVRLWDTTAQRRLPDLVQHDTAIGSLGISPDGRILAIGDVKGAVQLWNIESQCEVGLLPGHYGRVNSIAFSPDGETLAAASYGQEVRLWDVTTRTAIGSLPHGGPVEAVAFSRDGKFLATGSSQTAQLWDVVTRKPLKTFKGHIAAVWWVAFSPDSKTLATASADGTVRLWDSAPREEQNVLRHDAEVLTLAFSPDGQKLATGTADGALRLWDVTTSREMTRFPKQTNSIWTVGFSPNGELLASGSGVWYKPDVPGELKVWEIATQRETNLVGHKGGVYSVNFTPDSKMLVTSSSDQTVRLWEIATQRVLLTNMAPPEAKFDWNPITRLSPDGRTVVSVNENIITTWEIPSGKRLHTFETDANFHALSADGRTLAEVDHDGIQLWDMVHWKPPATLTLTGRPEPVKGGQVKGSLWDATCVAFAPDGRRLAIGTSGGTVKLWTTNNHEVLTLRGHSNQVSKVAFSPDGNILASASIDKTVRLWRVDGR